VPQKYGLAALEKVFGVLHSIFVWLVDTAFWWVDLAYRVGILADADYMMFTELKRLAVRVLEFLAVAKGAGALRGLAKRGVKRKEPPAAAATAAILERARLRYLEALKEIAKKNEQWLREGKTAKWRAREAHRLRHEARLRARAETLLEKVREAEAMDKKRYGNKDGPTFEQVVEKAKSKGLKGDAVYEESVRMRGEVCAGRPQRKPRSSGVSLASGRSRRAGRSARGLANEGAGRTHRSRRVWPRAR
jgi:hypothetical protein